MSIEVHFKCSGCDAVADGTRPIRRDFIPRWNSSEWGAFKVESVTNVTPPGWVPFCPAGATYCPKCAKEIWPEDENQEPKS